MKSIDDAAGQALLDWYRRSARRLPWRDTRDPYAILVSEVMLQQTQADRVVPKYHEFLARFPTVEALAEASPAEVIRVWAGLGYNRRALNLQRACRAVVERFGGSIPSSVEDLTSLPGVGAYTAGAIACFAFGQDVGFVDTNIRRVLHRIAAGPEIPEPKLNPREVGELAAASVPEGHGYEWNQALMELGATVCRARSAACLVCPVNRWCVATPGIQALLATAPRTANGTSTPFEQTTRYVRGRIVHALRDASDHGVTAEQIFESILGGNGAIARERFGACLADLVREGMVERVEERPRAAEDSVSYDGKAAPPEPLYRLPR